MKRLLLFLMGIVSFFSFGQDGTLDTSFGNNGYAITDFFGRGDRGSSVAVQSNGKIVLFGYANHPDSYFVYGLVRYMPDGAIDNTFGEDGLVTLQTGNSYREYFNSIHILADQKIITTTTYFQNDETDFMLVRYLPDGQIDNSFGVDGIVRTDYSEDYLSATVLLPDEKILAGGSTTIGVDNSILLVKYLPDGSLDASFGTNGMIVHFINNEAFKVFGIKVQIDGKILVPYRTEENFANKFQIARFLPTGVLDSSFGSAGVLELDSTNLVSHAIIAIQDDGKILASLRKNTGTLIKRVLPEGTIDNTFGNSGMVEISEDSFTTLKILLQPDSKIILFGATFFFEPDFNHTYRLNPDGSLDNTFGTNGFTALGFEGADIAFQQDGKIIVAGNTFFYSGSGESFAVARLNNEPLSVTEFEKNQITIYPNPSNGIFTIERELFSEAEYYQITDVTGKNIKNGVLEEKQPQIDLSSAQSGVYFLRISNKMFRIIKN